MTLRDLPYSIPELFPAGDFAFHMKFRRGEIADFFRNRGGTATLAERKKWLAPEPHKYIAALPGSEPLLEEAAELARSLNIETASTIQSLAENWEPDLLLLRAESTQHQPRLLAGAVCFPSSWALEEKMGQPLDAIHEPVPTLNTQFANPIQQFLARIKPGISWERINWGLSRSPELNQHPSRNLPRLNDSVTLHEVWFRAEYQSLIALPKSLSVLFGIRLIIEPLAQLIQDPAFREGITRALLTMPDPIARYKGIALSRQRLLQLLHA